MRKISNVEHTARQLVLRAIAPACLAAIDRASGLAETRFRRAAATQRHVCGAGIEVGAAATPALVPLGAQVKYVDKYGIDELLSDPELVGLKLRAPDIRSSAEKLEEVATDSQDFVLAFSLLEHVQDALGTIASFVRVTRDGGSIVLTVPDKRYYGPDKPRQVTPFEHFVRDFREGPGSSVAEHFREIGTLRHALDGAALDRFVEEKIAKDAHTHFHVWDAESFLTFLLQARGPTGTSYEVVEFAAYAHEALAVLRVKKLARSHASS